MSNEKLRFQARIQFKNCVASYADVVGLLMVALGYELIIQSRPGQHSKYLSDEVAFLLMAAADEAAMLDGRMWSLLPDLFVGL